MAVPKRRVSKARRDKRRSNVWKMDAPELVKCPNCGEYKRPHRICQELRLLQRQGNRKEGRLRPFEASLHATREER